MAPKALQGGMNLIFDADDTLWESNIHFLEAQAAFLEILQVTGASDHGEIRAAIRRHELDIIAEMGYGRLPFILALHRVVRELLPLHLQEPLGIAVERIGARLMRRDCELLPGVLATLEALSRRHRLLLFTKGQPQEQITKLARAGLRRFFSRVGIPLEKDTASYRLLLAQAELDPTRTFMIGNSPRSDINPAIRAGLRGAVLIPHPYTWELECEELEAADERVVTINGFARLLDLF